MKKNLLLDGLPHQQETDQPSPMFQLNGMHSSQHIQDD